MGWAIYEMIYKDIDYHCTHTTPGLGIVDNTFGRGVFILFTCGGNGNVEYGLPWGYRGLDVHYSRIWATFPARAYIDILHAYTAWTLKRKEEKLSILPNHAHSLSTFIVAQVRIVHSKHNRISTFPQTSVPSYISQGIL
jgi:hypothetical protein